MPELPLDLQNPWETPPAELDPELIATSQRLVAKSAAVVEQQDPIAVLHQTDEMAVSDPHLHKLETQVQHLLKRNTMLVAKVAQLESANVRLQEQLSKARQTLKTPWFRRWFQRSPAP